MIDPLFVDILPALHFSRSLFSFYFLSSLVKIFWHCIQEVSKKIENVYSKFKHMLMKRDVASVNAMTAILTK